MLDAWAEWDMLGNWEIFCVGQLQFIGDPLHGWVRDQHEVAAVWDFCVAFRVNPPFPAVDYVGRTK